MARCRHRTSWHRMRDETRSDRCCQVLNIARRILQPLILVRMLTEPGILIFLAAMKTLFIAGLVVLCLTVSAQTTIEPRYTADGQLTRPENYREWIYLSSGLGMSYGPNASTNPENPNFDNVFV